jgi:ABC-type nitrate/sulfonate/bicarbonate transport system substrate-binding protein
MVDRKFDAENRPRWRPAACLLMLVLAAVGLAACGSSDGEESASSGEKSDAPAQVRIASIPAFGSLPLRVAEVEGFFEKEGLDVTVTPTQDLGAAVAALGKQFDITLGSIPILVSAAAQGVEVQAISAIQDVDAEHPNNVLIAKEPIEDYAALAGKQVGVISTSGGSAYSVQYLAKKAGVDPKQVQVKTTPLPTMADQVKAGRLDAAVSAIPFFTGLDDMWVSEDVTWEAVHEIDPNATQAPTGMMITSKKWAADNPDTVAAYRKAVADAVTWIDQNDAGARKILSEWTKLDPKVVDASPFPLFAVKISAEQVQAQMTMMEEVGALPPSAPEASELVVEGSDQEP